MKAMIVSTAGAVRLTTGRATSDPRAMPPVTEIAWATKPMAISSGVMCQRLTE